MFTIHSQEPRGIIGRADGQGKIGLIARKIF
jgi:hypothetical protein